MSQTRQSNARNVVVGCSAGREKMCIPLCSSGGRESQHQLTSASTRMFAHCPSGWRRSECHPSSGFTEVSVSVVIDLTIHGSASDAPRLTACGARPRLSQHRHLLATSARAICSAQSVLMFGGESAVAVCIYVLDVAGSRDWRETVPPNHALQRTRRERRGCNRRLPCAGSLSLGR